MSRLWWSLPGPSKFIDDIVSAIRDGKNVLVRLPEFAPRELRAAVKRALGTDFYLSQLNAPEDFRPIQLLYSSAVSEPHEKQVRNAETLVAEPTFRGQVLWIRGVDEKNRAEWLDFLLEYEHASRAVPEAERSLLCLVLEGLAAMYQMQQAVGIRTVTWNGYATFIDAQLYAAHLSDGRFLNALHQRLAVSLLATLSKWDPLCCEYLSEQPLESLMQPVDSLKGLAGSRKWTCEGAPPEIQWARGMFHRFEGKQSEASATLAVRDLERLETLVWSAEVGVMFPYVEEERHELLKRYNNVLRVPFPTRYGLITDKLDLEIGHIEAQLREIGFVRESELQSVERLRKIRNHLSHLEPLPMDLVTTTPSIARTAQATGAS